MFIRSRKRVRNLLGVMCLGLLISISAVVANDNAQALREAVDRYDPEAAVKLMQGTGSAGKCLELIKAAQGKFSLTGLAYSIVVDGDKEVLTVYRSSGPVVQPIAGVTFKQEAQTSQIDQDAAQSAPRK